MNPALRALRTAGAVALLAWGSDAHAQSASKAAAEKLFGEGRDLVRQGRSAEACPKFAESQKLDPGAGTLLNLGDCYERVGRTASAWLAYSEAVAMAERSGRTEWRQQAQAKVTSLKPRLSTLTVVFPDPRPAGLEVRRDGEPLDPAASGVAIPADPGPHDIEASAPARNAYRVTVQLAANGGDARVALPSLAVDGPPAASPAAPPAARAEAPATPDGRTAAGGTLLGLGIVGLAVGGVAGALALVSKSRAVDHCSPDLQRCRQEGLDSMAAARGQALVSTVGFAIGGVAVATGTILLLTVRTSRARAATLEVTPWLTGGALRVRF